MLNLTDRRKHVFTEATVVKTTEAAASAASNVATALYTALVWSCHSCVP